MVILQISVKQNCTVQKKSYLKNLQLKTIAILNGLFEFEYVNRGTTHIVLFQPNEDYATTDLCFHHSTAIFLDDWVLKQVFSSQLILRQHSITSFINRF